MARLRIVHETRYIYRGPVGLGPHRLRLRPIETKDLRLTAFDLSISPHAAIDWSTDVWGNSVATASFEGEHDMLWIRSEAVVEQRAPAWPVFPIAGDATTFPFLYHPDDRIDLGALSLPHHADDMGRLRAWTSGFVMAPSTDTLSLLKDISSGVADAIRYETREAEGTQSPLETLGRGVGSCRDLAVLFAEAVRTLGFGARLVSGYLHDDGADGVGVIGAGATHAWAEVFLPGAGWIPFDPTNRSVGSARLVPVAVARSIGQVSPVTGSFAGAPSDLRGLEVDVQVKAD
ncbi:MAG: transglutaminase family protein [Paracoccaceae bacterium]|nr:transglutaminase family protein [Paracoccaceae bacterium]